MVLGDTKANMGNQHTKRVMDSSGVPQVDENWKSPPEDYLRYRNLSKQMYHCDRSESQQHSEHINNHRTKSFHVQRNYRMVQTENIYLRYLFIFCTSYYSSCRCIIPRNCSPSQRLYLNLRSTCSSLNE